MNKKLISALALSAALLTSGCNKPAEQTTTASEQTTASEAVTTASETATAAPETTTTAETSAVTEATEDNSNKTLIRSFPNGTELYLEDAASATEYTVTFDTAFVRTSTGAYTDSDLTPELFDPSIYSYTGETAESGEYTTVKAGDKIGGAEIEKAEFTFGFYEDGNGGTVYYPMSNSVVIKGDYTFSGVLYYYYDDQYTVVAGDIQFLPDSTYKGMPITDLNDEYGGRSNKGSVLFGVSDDGKLPGGVSAYSDAPIFRAGNLFKDYPDNETLNSLLDGGNTFCSKKVNVTLSGVELTWSDQFGSMWCMATISDIAEIK